MNNNEDAYNHIMLTINMLVMRWDNFKYQTKNVRYTSEQHWRLDAVNDTINELLRTKEIIFPLKEEEIINVVD